MEFLVSRAAYVVRTPFGTFLLLKKTDFLVEDLSKLTGLDLIHGFAQDLLRLRDSKCAHRHYNY